MEKSWKLIFLNEWSPCSNVDVLSSKWVWSSGAGSKLNRNELSMMMCGSALKERKAYRELGYYCDCQLGD